jgi:hypothetical protein
MNNKNHNGPRHPRRVFPVQTSPQDLFFLFSKNWFNKENDIFYFAS